MLDNSTTQKYIIFYFISASVIRRHENIFYLFFLSILDFFNFNFNLRFIKSAKKGILELEKNRLKKCKNKQKNRLLVDPAHQLFTPTPCSNEQ